jgi:hypothetical protein
VKRSTIILLAINGAMWGLLLLTFASEAGVWHYDRAEWYVGVPALMLIVCFVPCFIVSNRPNGTAEANTWAVLCLAALFPYLAASGGGV